MTEPRPESLRRSATPHAFVAFALTLLPLFLLIAYVARFGVDVPYWDQWVFVPLLKTSYEGVVTLPALCAQHNEHRLLFPRLIMLVLAHATHWNIRAEMLVTITLALGLYGVLAAQFRETLRIFKIGSTGLWIFPILSLLVFSLTQWENWLWGWQLQILLNLVAGTAALTILGRSHDARIGPLVLAVVLAFIATYSFSNGLLLWPIGLVVLAVLWRGAPAGSALRRTRALGLLLWGFASAAVIVTYLWRFQRDKTPQGVGPAPSALHHLATVALYILNYLGAPLSPTRLAALFGLAGIAAVFFLSRALLRSRPNALPLLMPWFALMAYALCSAVITAFGRAQLGAYQAVDSRYVTISSLLWQGIVVLLFLAGTPTERLPHDYLPRWPRAALVGIVVLAVSASGIGGLRGYYTRYQKLRDARDLVRDGKSDESTLGALYLETDLVRDDIQFLRQRHLSLFRD